MSVKRERSMTMTNMEGMIYNANLVLDKALDPKTPGIPRDIFFDCRGILLVSTAEAGFIISVHGGTGVVLGKDQDGKWGMPSAIGTGGVGFGALFGAEVKDIMVVLLTDDSVKAFASDKQVKLGSQVGIAVGPIGREMESSLTAGKTGATPALSYVFTKGVFGGAGIQGAAFKARNGENEKFYGAKTTPEDILLKGAVTAPEGKGSEGIKELHRKLELLAQGKTETKETSDNAKETGEDAKETGEDAKETGEDAKETGEDAKETGEDAKETGEDAKEKSEEAKE